MIHRIVVEVSDLLAKSEKDAIRVVRDCLDDARLQRDGYWHGRVKSLNRMLAGLEAQGRRRRSPFEWAADLEKIGLDLRLLANKMRRT